MKIVKRRVVNSNRYTSRCNVRAADDADKTTIGEMFEDKLDKVKSDFDYALSGLDFISGGDPESIQFAMQILDDLSIDVNNIISRIADATPLEGE